MPSGSLGNSHVCDYEFYAYCGAWVCPECNDHRGLERCYCGWSRTSPGQGRRELEESGEVIDSEDSFFDTDWDY
jgi:hypothetical protein